MKKILFVILLPLYTANVFASGGNIGEYDNRQYSSLANPEYNSVVKLYVGENRTGRCTGTFISKSLILTNSHCAVKCKDGCSADFYNGSGYEKSNLEIVAYHENYKINDGTDWALLLSDKENNSYVSVLPNTVPGQVISGGFGSLRIIKNEEIPFLKKIYSETEKEFRSECKKEKSFYACINKQVDIELKKMGKEPLFEDTNKFKIKTCNILGQFSEYKNMINTDCELATGDSGSSLLRNRFVVGLLNSGDYDLFVRKEKAGARGLKNEVFYELIQKYIKKYEQNSVENNNFTGINSGNGSSSGNNTNINVNGSQNQQPDKPNINVNASGQIYDNQQKIDQILQQKIQDFDCD